MGTGANRTTVALGNSDVCIPTRSVGTSLLGFCDSLEGGNPLLVFDLRLRGDDGGIFYLLRPSVANHMYCLAIKLLKSLKQSISGAILIRCFFHILNTVKHTITQYFTQLYSPLIEGVYLPENTLNKDFLFV